MGLLKSTATLLLAVSLATVSAIVVNSSTGPIEGKTNDHADLFLGIPYAEAPIGMNRFAEVPLKAPWKETFRAFDDPPGCPQTCQLPPHTCATSYKEDCLLLNVFTPKDASTKNTKLPVLVYFHGGNYKQGYGGGDLYFGDKLSEQTGTIIVSVNYRLGSLGYLAAPELGITGNFGVHDQRVSLEWVQANIEAFGGDESNVTIFGQSAGAGSVAVHMTSPKSKGLFHRAWLLSNPFGIPLRSPKSAPAITNVFLKNTNCEDLACLRTLDVDELIDAQNASETDKDAMGDTVLHAFLPWTPYVDGFVVPQQPIHAFAAGMAADVPVVLGTVKDEAVPFIYEAFGKPLDSTGYAIFVGVIFGLDKAGAVLSRYPANNATDADQRDTLVTVGNEFIFHCPLRNATRALFSSVKQSNVYQYLYEHPLSFGDKAWGKDFPECAEDVTCHAAELPIVWNSAQKIYPYTEQENTFAGIIGQYLGNFAWTGNPNKGPVAPKLTSAPGVAWPQFWERGQQLTLKPDNIVPTDKFTTQCDFWDSVGYIM